MDIITTVFRVVRNAEMEEFLKLEFIKVWPQTFVIIPLWPCMIRIDDIRDCLEKIFLRGVPGEDVDEDDCDDEDDDEEEEEEEEHDCDDNEEEEENLIDWRGWQG